MSYSHNGASHDLSCLRETLLDDKLVVTKAKLYEIGFLLGGYAYGIESFLLPPYANASPQKSKDGFNFYRSNARITVEYTFSEIDCLLKRA